MHAKRRSAAERRSRQVLWHPLFIKRVPCLVHRSEEGRRKKIRNNTCRDAHVRGAERGAEGMHRKILPSPRQVVAPALDDLEAKGKLLLRLERLSQAHV